MLTLEAINAETGDVMAREQVEAASKEQILTSLGTAASGMREKLGESLASIQKFDVPLPRATTASLDALHAYSLALSEGVEVPRLEAIPQLQRAIDLDPTFAMAHAFLSGVYVNTGQSALAPAYSRRAFELRDRVSERERFFISWRYYRDAIQDWEKALELGQSWTATYPREALRSTVSGPLSSDSADSSSRSRRFARPSVSIPSSSRRTEISPRRYLRSTSLTKHGPSSNRPLSGSSISSAPAGCHTSLPSSRGIRQRWRALSLSSEVAKRFPDATLTNRVSLPVTAAAVAIEQGEPARGLAPLEPVRGYDHAPSAEFWPAYLRGQAYLQLKDGRAAATEFENIVTHRGEVPVSVLYPLAHVGLARAAAMSNDAEKARKAYEAFFALWNTADSDLPVLRDARLEYSRLSEKQHPQEATPASTR